jgi:hypothetical protein
MFGESCADLFGVVAGSLAYAQSPRYRTHLIEQSVAESLGTQNLDCIHASLPHPDLRWLIIA